MKSILGVYYLIRNLHWRDLLYEASAYYSRLSVRSLLLITNNAIHHNAIHSSNNDNDNNNNTTTITTTTTTTNNNNDHSNSKSNDNSNNDNTSDNNCNSYLEAEATSRELICCLCSFVIVRPSRLWLVLL